MLRLTLVVVPLLALAGCKTENTAFCAMNPGMQGCPDAATSGGSCHDSTDCKLGNFPLCDTTDNTCVQCTTGDQTHCMGMTPRCDNRECVACVDDSDCDSGVGVCLPSGGCADLNNIIYAVPSGGLPMAPCGGMGVGNACTLDTALTLATTSKNVIKLDAGIPYTSDTNYIVDTAPAIGLTIDARGAVLHRITDGAILTINSDKAVTILGGTIEGAKGGGGGGDGIRCNANGTLGIYGTTIRTNEESAIDAATCTVVVTGAEIRGNSTKLGTALYPGIQITDGSITISRSSIVSNRGGGLAISNNATFEVVGNVFLSNGDSLGNVGGVSINTTGPGDRLEFNTITQNKSDTALAAGVQCTLAGFTAQNNIIWHNNNAPAITGIQVSGTCSHAYSDIGPTFSPTTNDHDNVNTDPSFINEFTNLHLQPGTMVRGKANPGTDLTGIASKDMDGKVRIRPADLGAYVAPPQ